MRFPKFACISLKETLQFSEKNIRVPGYVLLVPRLCFRSTCRLDISSEINLERLSEPKSDRISGDNPIYQLSTSPFFMIRGNGVGRSGIPSTRAINYNLNDKITSGKYKSHSRWWMTHHVSDQNSGSTTWLVFLTVPPLLPRAQRFREFKFLYFYLFILSVCLSRGMLWLAQHNLTELNLLRKVL